MTLTQARLQEIQLDDDAVVGLAGDWHGRGEWARRIIEAFARLGIKRIYHLGDFGVWPGSEGHRFLTHVHIALYKHDMELWVTPGNHEDYDQINALVEGERGLHWMTSTIGILPRGFRWEQGGRSFVSLGGAPSIDYELRTQGRSWWRDEMITLEEADRVAAGGHADVFLAHDAPSGGTAEVQRIVNTPWEKSIWSEPGLRYAAEGRQLMDIAFEGVKPKLFAHGHYHVSDDTGPVENGTRYVSLDCDGAPRNACLLRLSDLAISYDGTVWV